MNILIITKDSFPTGLAASSRIHAYSKGIIEHGSKVKVLCIKPTERQSSIFNKVIKGTHEGIPFIYTSGETIYSSWFLKRRIQNIAGIIGALKTLVKDSRIHRVDAIIVYLKAPLIELILFLFASILNIIIIKEENEHPEIYFPPVSCLNKIVGKYYMKYNYRLYDGILLMTHNLIDVFTGDKKLKARILHTPMIVDYKRFENVTGNFSSESYIAFCGILNNNKDGINYLINAFSALTNAFPDLKLVLIGDAENEVQMKDYVDLIRAKQIVDKVIFKGRVDNSEMPRLLCNAKLLVLPRPSSTQAEYGFPTKLGEYLATGKPVVVTRTGEISQYLTDGQNAFLAEAGDTDSLALKMGEALSDYNRALEIGKMGKDAVMHHFNYYIQAGRIIDFIKRFN